MNARAMRAGALAAAVLLLVAGCGGDAVPAGEVFLGVTTHTDEVVLGQAFPLTVVRAWGEGLEPSPWDEESVPPLVLRLEERSVRNRSGRIEETIRYRAYAFEPGEMVVPRPSFEAAPPGGGAPRSASADPLRLRVQRAVDPADPGEVELPGGLVALPASRLPWIVGLALAVVAGVMLLRPRRRAVPPVVVAPPPAVPVPCAAESLAALRARLPQNPDALLSWYTDLFEILREDLAAAAGPGLRARLLTSEDLRLLLADVALRSTLREVLDGCDLVRFGGHLPVEEDCLRDVDRAAQVLARGGGLS